MHREKYYKVRLLKLCFYFLFAIQLILFCQELFILIDLDKDGKILLRDAVLLLEAVSRDMDHTYKVDTNILYDDKSLKNKNA